MRENHEAKEDEYMTAVPGTVNMEALLETAVSASQRACEKILAVYGTDFLFTPKEDQSPLTLADTASHEVILSLLREACPGIPVLSEEGEKDVPRDAEYCWVVDPLDGTKEFIKRNGEFTVNIALTHNRIPLLGVIAVPVTGAVYFASRGGGAFKRENGGITRLRVSSRTEGLIWAGSKSHSTEKEAELIQQKRRLIKTMIQAGSSLKGVMVARGDADVYYRFGLTSEWDTCAMHLIVEESGGIFRQMDHSEMTYCRENHLNEKGFYAVNRAENIWV